MNITRTSHNWKKFSYDPFNLGLMNYSSGNGFDFPDLLPQDFELSDSLKSFPYTANRLRMSGNFLLHFFIDDYRFSGIWTYPQRCLKRLSKIKPFAIVSPDFSILGSMPVSLRIFQIYRSRALARYFQENGYNIIFSVSWADSRDFDYCFLGIPEDSIIALAPPTSAPDFNREDFEAGLDYVLDVVNPRLICSFSDYDYRLPPDSVVYFSKGYYSGDRQKIGKDIIHYSKIPKRLQKEYLESVSDDRDIYLSKQKDNSPGRPRYFLEYVERGEDSSFGGILITGADGEIVAGDSIII